jgi:hypothetical protein
MTVLWTSGTCAAKVTLVPPPYLPAAFTVSQHSRVYRSTNRMRRFIWRYFVQLKFCHVCYVVSKYSIFRTPIRHIRPEFVVIISTVSLQSHIYVLPLKGVYCIVTYVLAVAWCVLWFLSLYVCKRIYSRILWIHRVTDIKLPSICQKLVETLTLAGGVTNITYI